jgi:hypothetical protein
MKFGEFIAIFAVTFFIIAFTGLMYTSTPIVEVAVGMLESAKEIFLILVG